MEHERFSNDYINQQIDKFYHCDMTFSEIGRLVDILRARVNESRDLRVTLEAVQKREEETRLLLSELVGVRSAGNTRGVNTLGLARLLLQREAKILAELEQEAAAPKDDHKVQPIEPKEITDYKKAMNDLLPKGTVIQMTAFDGQEFTWAVGTR